MIIDIKNISDYKLYYYDNEWQKPVITEYQVFKLFNESSNIPADYFAFPWATLIDNFNGKNKKLYNFVSNYKVNSKTCFTVMQHIHYYKFLDIVRDIGITHVFTPHKDTGYEILEEKYGIKIIAISLYPAQAINNFNNIKPIFITDKKYLASFIGQYDSKCYLSNIRDKIFTNFTYDNCYIKRRKEWHYQGMVYRNNKTTNTENELEYIDNLNNTKFSLCPSGSGPNSIRIWESISYGSIPVILADTLILPNINNIDWSKYFIIWKESELDKLHEHLVNISENKLIELSENCKKLYDEYFCPDNFNKIILNYFYRKK